ncbi:MAG: hypothetical protein KJS98_19930, partial [Nitrospirae bacterium]|nr:hypothetical protein [Nitrospirota bacterium]
DARRTSSAGVYCNLFGFSKHLIFDLIPDGLWNDLPLHQSFLSPVRTSSNDAAHIGDPNPRQGFEVPRRGRVQVLRLTTRLSPPVTENLWGSKTNRYSTHQPSVTGNRMGLLTPVYR